MRRGLGVMMVLALIGCGDGGGDGDGGGGGGDGAGGPNGQVTEAFSKYCVATFTADHEVIDVFGDPELSIAKGEKFLLREYGSFSTNEATILYLADEGSVDFTIVAENGEPFPFDSNCEVDQVQRYAGVFQEVTVYEDEALTKEACTLKQGTVELGDGVNYELVSELFEEPSVYRMEIGALSEHCDGLTEGYVEAYGAMIGETQYSALPINDFIGPR